MNAAGSQENGCTGARLARVIPTERRLLLVHAHPDDETIATGATMARYRAEGAEVTLVTCTLGEEGEIVVADLAHLAANQEDRLGEHRIGELAAACRELGVADHRFLGGPGRWRDSGMMGVAANDNPRCFWRADIGEAVEELVRVIREVRPQVVVTYNENGAYGHPDHIKAHEVTVAALPAAADETFLPQAGPAWTVAKLYYTAMPKSVLQAGIEAVRAQGGDFFEGVTSADDLPFAEPDELITTVIDASAYHERKLAALRAHRSQVSVDGPFFALADGELRAAFSVEHYRLAGGRRGPGGGDTPRQDGPRQDGPRLREDDLFAGL